MKKSKLKYCKGCKYYTGILCHGHGDFWGQCRKYKGDDPWGDVCYDDTLCPYYKGNLEEIERLKKEEEERKKNSTGNIVSDIARDLQKSIENLTNSMRPEIEKLVNIFVDKKEHKEKC